VSFLAPATTMEPVRVMLCDDSAVQRGIMARILETDPGIKIVHRAGDGQAALSALAVTKPQVVLLDLEMPVMDGMTAIPLILKQAPGTAIIVASALTQRGAAAAMAALRAGAVDYLPKPQGSLGGAASPIFREELIAKVQGLGAHAPRAGGALASAAARANRRAAHCAPYRKANVAAALAGGGQFYRRAASLGRILQASATAAHSGGHCAAHAGGLHHHAR
jgi:two-component system, chemotaxis family, protein-glutamate methylesterase/glutaminase